jgi:hypothetical protein
LKIPVSIQYEQQFFSQREIAKGKNPDDLEVIESKKMGST